MQKNVSDIAKWWQQFWGQEILVKFMVQSLSLKQLESEKNKLINDSTQNNMI